MGSALNGRKSNRRGNLVGTALVLFEILHGAPLVRRGAPLVRCGAPRRKRRLTHTHICLDLFQTRISCQRSVSRQVPHCNNNDNNNSKIVRKMVVNRMDGILSRLRNNDESVRALDLSTRDDLEFQFLFPEGTMPDSQHIPSEWCKALAQNNHVRELCLYASFLDTVDQHPARHSRFAVLMELFSHLQSLEELEVHAFSVPTRIFPVIPLANLLARQATSLRKLALYNIRSEGIVSHTEGFRSQLAHAISSMTSLEELVWEPFPLDSTNRNEQTQEEDDARRAVDEALVSAIIGLTKLRRLSLCAKSVNILMHPLERLPLSRRCLANLWKKSELNAVHLTGFSLTSDDLRVLLGISKRRPTPQRQLVELHLSQCLLEEPAALLEYLKVNTSLRRLVLTDTLIGIRIPTEQQDETDPYQQRDFLQQVAKVLECQNTTLHWVVTRSPLSSASSPTSTATAAASGAFPRQPHAKLETLLHLNRSGLRDVALRPELQFSCPRHVWPEFLHALGRTSPTAVADLLQRNFEAFFVRPSKP